MSVNYYLTSVLLSGKDLFNEAWTTGNLYSLGGWVEKLGNFSCVVISFVGFGIVIFSILKNALSGLYVVNPNFWDKVDEIKTAMIGSNGDNGGMINGMISGAASAVPGKGNAAAQKIGGLFTYLLSAIPNVKALTDFDGSEGAIDKKQYFARSIPLLVAQIFIGMLIFFGYPSKIANWIGSAGTQLLDMLIDNTDPVAFVSTMTGKIIKADFSYASSEDPYEKMIYKAAADAWTAVVGHATDIEKAPRQQVAYELESWIYTTFSMHQGKIGATEGYTVSESVSYTTTQPVMPQSLVEGTDGVYVSTAANGTVTYRAYRDVSSLPHGSTMVGATDYIVVTFTCTPKALTSTTTTTGIIHMGKGQPVKTSSGYTVPLESIFSYSEKSQNNCIVGTPISVTVELYNGDVLNTSVSGSLHVSAGNLQLLIPKGVDESVLGNSDKWILNFGFNTSSLKYVAIEGTVKVEVPITSFVIDGNKGLELNSSAEGSVFTDSASVIKELKTGNSANTEN